MVYVQGVYQIFKRTFLEIVFVYQENIFLIQQIQFVYVFYML